MTKQELNEMVATYKQQTRDALQEVFDSLNNGQKNKLLKNDDIVTLFKRFGVGGE